MIDRRGVGVAGATLGGAGILVAILVALLGGDPTVVLGPDETAPAASRPRDPAEDRLAEFASVVLADTEDTWSALFARQGGGYEPPKLVLFTDQVPSACGHASAAVGPFYCPLDRRVYLDLGFFDDLDRRFGAPGDFAQAYVIAHEVGHHVQTLLGISARVRAGQQRSSRGQANQLSVALELQADCMAGVWAHHAHRTRNLLEQGDVEEGLRAASAIGDDTLQRRSGGRVAPESFTHGTAQQRAHWFKRGMERGSLDACDTFGENG